MDNTFTYKPIERNAQIVVHAGGNEVPLHFTQENHEQIAVDMQLIDEVA